jgi:hypothetical protein
MKITSKLDKKQIKDIYGKRKPSANKKPRNNDKYGFCKPQKTAIARHWGLPNDRSCWACGATDCEEIHGAHIRRREYGGLNIPSNFHLLCIACHGESEFLDGESYKQWFLLKRKYFKQGSLDLGDFFEIAHHIHESAKDSKSTWESYQKPIKYFTDLHKIQEIVKHGVRGKYVYYTDLKEMKSDWEFDVYE